ncbi:MAG: RlmE family RNA methyltransferase [Alphaproteobacteria bacterium]|jgi:23S rRNA (uridine2552-2'-O)-methyltransferase|nr:RlmE family RNA methyltransferase [Alphaproteobacteria bacterium]MDP6568047.1 RlmE family RNA methyltransferase [Alphaproteobacteria bacterium]MDP6815574.1 RlmE family RNA methyltransferase [Alphaproteobacteria bacterium]
MAKKPGRSGGARRSGPSGRDLSVRVRTARRRKTSSTRWLQRQLNDPYVAAARREGYRSRAAYKLLQLDERFRFLKPGLTAVDLGAAPGGWTQVLIEALGPSGRVLAVDLVEVESLGGAEVMQADVSDPANAGRIRGALDGGADLVLSDMAPTTTGHRATDHLRIVALVEDALALAMDLLRPGGCFVAKVWQGGTEDRLLAAMKRHFTSVRHAKPPASRADSAEMYVVATGYRGGEANSRQTRGAD